MLEQNDQTFGQLVGGARTYYSFELFLEIRKEEEKFQKYGRGGKTVAFSCVTLSLLVVRFFKPTNMWLAILLTTHILTCDSLKAFITRKQNTICR